MDFMQYKGMSLTGINLAGLLMILEGEDLKFGEMVDLDYLETGKFRM